MAFPQELAQLYAPDEIGDDAPPQQAKTINSPALAGKQQAPAQPAQDSKRDPSSNITSKELEKLRSWAERDPEYCEALLDLAGLGELAAIPYGWLDPLYTWAKQHRTPQAVREFRERTLGGNTLAELSIEEAAAVLVSRPAPAVAEG
jgi:hypothetical protein